LQYFYDEVGNLVTLTYPDGRQVHYEYDAANRLVKVIDWAARVTTDNYDKNGRLINTLRPNGTQQSRVYDDAGQLVQFGRLTFKTVRWPSIHSVFKRFSALLEMTKPLILWCSV